MLSMAAAPGIGLLGIYGAVIGAGIFGVLAAPFISRLLPMFPPVVTGTIILVIGISLMRVGINWAGGGLQTFTKVVDGTPAAISEPCLWSAHRSRRRAIRAGRYPLADQMGARLRRERRGAVGNCRRRGARRGNRVDAFRKSRNGALGRYRVAVPFRRAGIPPDPNHHDVHRHGGGHDRITRHVSRSW